MRYKLYKKYNEHLFFFHPFINWRKSRFFSKTRYFKNHAFFKKHAIFPNMTSCEKITLFSQGKITVFSHFLEKIPLFQNYGFFTLCEKITLFSHFWRKSHFFKITVFSHFVRKSRFFHRGKSRFFHTFTEFRAFFKTSVFLKNSPIKVRLEFLTKIPCFFQKFPVQKTIDFTNSVFFS